MLRVNKTKAMASFKFQMHKHPSFKSYGPLLPPSPISATNESFYLFRPKSRVHPRLSSFSFTTHHMSKPSDCQIRPQTWPAGPPLLPQQTPASSIPSSLQCWWNERHCWSQQVIPKVFTTSSPTYPSFPFYVLTSPEEENMGCFATWGHNVCSTRCLYMINRLYPPWFSYFQAELLSTKVWQKNIVRN